MMDPADFNGLSSKIKHTEQKPELFISIITYAELKNSEAVDTESGTAGREMEITKVFSAPLPEILQYHKPSNCNG